MINEQDLIKSATTDKPIRSALGGQPFSRNRFLKIFSRNPAEYHPIFGAYDVAPEMPIEQIAAVAQQKGDKVLVLEGDVAIKEGWAEKNETLQRRGNGLVLMRKPIIQPANEINNFIEGIGVYPLEDNMNVQIENTIPQPTAQGNPSDLDAVRANSQYLKPAA